VEGDVAEAADAIGLADDVAHLAVEGKASSQQARAPSCHGDVSEASDAGGFADDVAT
jgi:hypothetical protein